MITNGFRLYRGEDGELMLDQILEGGIYALVPNSGDKDRELGYYDVDFQFVGADESPPVEDSFRANSKAQTLYVSRRLKNAQAFFDWAKAQGFKSVVNPDDIHTTVAYSRQEVVWGDMGDHFDKVRVVGGERSIRSLGDKGAVVMYFESKELEQRWQELYDAGCSWDYDDFHPHVTITYDGEGVDLSKIEPFQDELVFGPERFEELDTDWSDKVVEQVEAAKALKK